MPPAAVIASKSSGYRSRARRLRHVYANRPAELHRQLCALAKSADHAPETRTYEPSSKAHTYADFLSSHIDGECLRYSKRLALVRQAKQFGISPFEANLLIAAVQHQLPRPGPEPRISTRSLWTLPFLAAVITQLAVIACVIWALN